MCKYQYSCVGPIELLCIICRTPDDILNLLQATMTPTQDALLYYNGRWNMSCQDDFGVTRSQEKIKKDLAFLWDVASTDSRM